MAAQTKPRDIRLADLGYYKLDYLKEIDLKNAFYISKLKIGTSLYKKNSNVKRRKYGSIIKYILASQIVFTARDIIHEENNKELSVLKSFSLVN